MSPHETHRRRSQETCVGAPSEGWAKKAAAVAHGGPWESREAPVPSARLHGVGCQVEVNNDKAFVRPSIDAFEGEPGHPPDLHLLLLHPTLLNPRWPDDPMRTQTLSLPLLNPIASCDSRQDEDGVCDTTRPLNQRSMSARKREEQQAEKQVDQQRSEFAPDLRFMDGLEEDFVLDGALMVVDAFATYRWVPERSLWMPVRAQVMVVDASNHSGLDPGRDFWRSLHHREEAPPDGLSDCETVRACPDCDGDVGVVEGAPIDESSDNDLSPLGESSDDCQK